MHIQTDTVVYRLVSYGSVYEPEHGTKLTVTLKSFADATSEVALDEHTFDLPEGQYDIAAYLVSADGPLAGGNLVEDAVNVTRAKAEALAKVVAARDTHIHGGVMTPAGTVDSDEVSIRNILGAYQAAMLSLLVQQPYSINWRMSDNSLVPLDAQGMIALGNAVLAHVQGCYEHSWALKANIEAAETATELTAVDIDAGWPGQEG